MTQIKTKIPAELEPAAVGGMVTDSKYVKDRVKNKTQKEINADTEERVSTLEESVGTGGSVDERIATAKNEVIGDAGTDYNTLGKLEDKLQEEVANRASQNYTKAETYSKTELNNMITTPSQKYVTVTATDQTTAVTDVLPVTGEADTIYRVGNWDGSQYDESVYSEYSWNGSTYIHLSTKTEVGEVYDISAAHATGGELATYADLAAALGTNGANIPQSLRKGGMSVKYVQSSDNKYVQYRLIANAWSTTESDWQGIDDEPTANSENLVKSGGVYNKTKYAAPVLSPFTKDEEIIFDQDTENYTAGLLQDNGTILEGYGGHTSDFIKVNVGDIIVQVNAVNYNDRFPTILGYDKNKNVFGRIAGKLTSTEADVNPDVYYPYYWFIIPIGIEYIRVCSSQTPFKFLRVDIRTAVNKLESYKDYINGYTHVYKSKRDFGNYPTLKDGSEYIPVYPGMTVFTTAKETGTVYAIELYNPNKESIHKYLFGGGSGASSDSLTESGQGFSFYTFTENIIKEYNIGYLKTNSLNALRTNEQTVEAIENTFFFDINDVYNQQHLFGYLIKNGYFHEALFKPIYTSLLADASFRIYSPNTSVERDTDGLNIRITFQTGAIVGDDRLFYRNHYLNQAVLVFYKIKLLSVENCQSVTVKGYFNNTPITRPITLSNVGESKWMLSSDFGAVHGWQYMEFSSKKINSSEPITVTVQLEEAIVTYSDKEHISDIRGLFLKLDDDVFDTIVENIYNNKKDINYAQISKYSDVCFTGEPNKYLKNRSYVAFGTSISAFADNYPTHIAEYFGMKRLTLGIGGGYPHGNSNASVLRPARLELIPSDTLFVTMCFGANSYIVDEDINSKDWEHTSTGAINNAIDYIQEHCPDAMVALGADVINDSVSDDLKRIAENRGCLFVNTYPVNGLKHWDEQTGTYVYKRMPNSEVSVEGLHMRALGEIRFAGCFIREMVKSLGFRGMPNIYEHAYY